MTERVFSIGEGSTHNQAATVNSSGGSGPDSYTVTLAAAGTNVVNGDSLTDSAANKYLIVSGAGTVNLTVADREGNATGPATGAGTIARYYSTLGAWETDLDDTNVYNNGDTSVGEGYADEDFSSDCIINGGTTITVDGVTLTVAEGERCNGIEGAGVRTLATSGGGWNIEISRNAVTIEYWELDYNGQSSTDLACIYQIVGGTGFTARYNVVHGLVDSGTNIGIWARPGSSGTADVFRNIVYDMENSHLSSDSDGIQLDDNTSATINCYNNTVHDIRATNGGNTSVGIYATGTAGTINVKNNIATDCESCFDISNADVNDYNCASDTSCGAGDGGNNIQSQTATALMNDPDGDPADLLLKSGSNAIDDGDNLGSSPTGVDTGIAGNAVTGTWDMGADEFVSVGSYPSTKKATRRPLLAM